MVGVVVYLVSDAIFLLPRHFVTGREEGVKIPGFMVEFVVERAAATLGFFTKQRTGRNSDLVGGGADGGFHVHPVGVIAQVLVAASGVVAGVQGRHPAFFRQTFFAAFVFVGQFAAFLVTE